MTRRADAFQTLHSEGGLLPADLLHRLLDPQEQLPGTEPEAYGLAPGERLNEVLTQSWNRLRRHWTAFREAAGNLAEGQPGTGLTNDRWKRFTFAEFAGNERKTSGSHYTPDSLVQCLLDSALDPVVEAALAGKRGVGTEQALVALKVCDPAVGSGHFLVGAAHRLARHLARAQAEGKSKPSPLLYQTALREVIGRCLYGVDVNPMAAELYRVNLWLEALEPGKPLSFLDHHIRVGNSLLGATPALIAQGIPDEAFKPITGDDPAFCREYKRQNQKERESRINDMFGHEPAPWERMGDLAAAMMELEGLDDATVAGIQAKQARYAELVREAGYLHGQLLADAWCAAFVWKKCKEPNRPYPILDDLLRKIEQNPFHCPKWMREEIERLATQYQFFHWYLAFPEGLKAATVNANRASR